MDVVSFKKSYSRLKEPYPLGLPQEAAVVVEAEEASVVLVVVMEDSGTRLGEELVWLWDQGAMVDHSQTSQTET